MHFISSLPSFISSVFLLSYADLPLSPPSIDPYSILPSSHSFFSSPLCSCLSYNFPSHLSLPLFLFSFPSILYRPSPYLSLLYPFLYSFFFIPSLISAFLYSFSLPSLLFRASPLTLLYPLNFRPVMSKPLPSSLLLPFFIS